MVKKFKEKKDQGLRYFDRKQAAKGDRHIRCGSLDLFSVFQSEYTL